jgi:hypothetical protein
MSYAGDLAKRWLSPGVLDRLETGRYHLNYRSMRLREGLAAARAGIRPRTRVLFYPSLPRRQTIVFRLCATLGYAITDDPRKPCDLVIKWENATASPRFEPLEELGRTQRVVNRFCNDISKVRVGRDFGTAFGYALDVDPLQHRGGCVEKSDKNASHDGRIVSCPLPQRRPGYVYQRLVDNRVDDTHVVDYRVPVLGTALPLVYLRRRPVERRFRSGNESVEIAHLYDVFDREEVRGILRFCELLGMEYGELDILRDREDGRVYVVDANTTPFGPPSGIGPEDSTRAVRLLAAAFATEFLRVPPARRSVGTGTRCVDLPPPVQ